MWTLSVLLGSSIAVLGLHCGMRRDECNCRLCWLIWRRYSSATARETLRRWVPDWEAYEVLDGNVSGKEGGRVDLFSRFDIEGNSPAATPDLVLTRADRVRAVIDVKYKPAKRVPDRAEINQVVCYGARYGCAKVIVVYPEVPSGSKKFCSIGMVGSIQLYRASLDLNATDLDADEQRFAESVFMAV